MQLKIQNLNKQYKNGVKALNNINLTIESGMFGLLGPNGAGKSTLMRTLATLQEADSGSVHLNDLDILQNQTELRSQLGYLPQEFGVYPRVSAHNLLDHMAILKGIDNKKVRSEMVDHLLQKVNLYEKRNEYVHKFSGGMRQRWGIAQCLIGQPQLVIVDEPTAGLDPGERNRFYNILNDIGEEVIVILSTHIVQDVRELCTHMAIMNNGEVLYTGKTDEALMPVKGKIFEKTIDKSELAEYEKNYKVISNKRVSGKPIIQVFAPALPESSFIPAEETLEHVYFAKLNQLI